MTSTWRLFLIGLAVHMTYNLIIIFTPSKLSAFFQPDRGQLTEVITDFSPDSRSYIEPADNFRDYGVFGKGYELDYHRTLGYPLILYFCKVLLGSYWYYGLALFQTVLGALIYPLTFLVGKLFFQRQEKLLFRTSICVMILGGYFTKSLYVLTDLSFSVFFLLGVYLSLLSVTDRKKYILIIPAIVALSFSGLIRPALILYPIANIMLLVYISRVYKTSNFRTTKWLIGVSTVVLAISCNYSAFRLYSRYGVFSPTDVLGINMFDYSTRNILMKEGKTENYKRFENSIGEESNWIAKDKMRRKYFFETIKKYPMAAISYWKQGAKSHLLSPHLMEIGAAYGFYKTDIYDKNLKLSKSIVMAIIFYTFYFIDVVIVVSFVLFFIEQFFKYKHFLFCLAILSLVLVIVGPSFIAASGSRMRIPIEPFILIFAIHFLKSKEDFFKTRVRFRDP
jgi:hypothetical protein